MISSWPLLSLKTHAELHNLVTCCIHACQLRPCARTFADDSRVIWFVRGKNALGWPKHFIRGPIQSSVFRGDAKQEKMLLSTRIPGTIPLHAMPWSPAIRPASLIKRRQALRQLQEVSRARGVTTRHDSGSPYDDLPLGQH